MNIIKCEGLAKNYANHNALHNLTCAIKSEKLSASLGVMGLGNRHSLIF